MPDHVFRTNIIAYCQHWLIHFNKASRLYKSSKCFDSDAILRWIVARVEFL